ncbi:hypothetical protein OE88DRAFT_1654609 [Heliocybe sulcata]|uniref:Expansin-like EG45 domain-containing protein n=1 Tax=Heliocybe sulcata TaxID=5364 RepID=A0A5C3N8U6_9AGAM|nr:hypothetical protein OE88DRAFT_1654609 [Heliocybe sulcata]
MLLHLWFWCISVLSALSATAQWIQYPPNGYATMTHYTMPANFIAACGCTTETENYPTAAMSQYAFGSSTSYGPGCGRCFNVTLLNTFTSDPPFYPTETKSVIIKVTDLCPIGGDGWCSATPSKPNPAGAYINFDLVYPSSAIPDNFFPSNVSLYGYTDFGVWNISYATVSCTDWAGYKNAAALGSVTSLGSAACCPSNPTGNSNNTCPSFSEQNGIPPDTHTSSAYPRTMASLSLLLFMSGLPIVI